MSAQTKMQLALIKSSISMQRYRFSSEANLRDLLANVLTETGYTVEREFQADPKNRFDLWLPNEGIAIECKIDGDMASAARQVQRYMAIELVQGVALVASCSWARGLTPAPQAKPLIVAHVQRQSL